MAKVPGSVWIEGTEIHIVTAGLSEYKWEGTYVTAPAGAIPGSLWVEGDNLHYIDALGSERFVNGPNSGARVGLAGSIWQESLFIAWLTETYANKIVGHNDVTHVDHEDTYATHTDVAHGDSHTDTHGDVAHSDRAHSDSHTDTHGDTAHTDQHGDTHTDHYDTYPPHIDSHGDYHNDIAHVDTHGDVAHADISHLNVAHTDTHGDVAHSDHTDSHDDSHTDHQDVEHTDLPVFVE